jgi:hypothetical protein
VLPVAAQQAAPPAEAASRAPRQLDTRIQQVKAEVLRLNRDLLVLEEELLFPASTQVAVFVSMDVGVLFELESVQVQLDGQVVATTCTRRRRSRRCSAAACNACSWAT